jgi:hypothetical protein
VPVMTFVKDGFGHGKTLECHDGRSVHMECVVK